MYKKCMIFALLAAHGALVCNDLRVMTYNIRRDGPEKQEDCQWKNRKESVVSLWRNLNPNIVGLQEVTDNQMQDLREQFKEFEFVGTGRGSSWFGLGDDEATPIGYKTDKFELQEHGTFSINKVDTWYGWMPWHRYQTGLLPRICTWAKLKDKQKNKEFYVYNTHLDHMYDEARVQGARMVMQDITARNTADLPVILTGDFNTPIVGEIKEVLSGFKHAKDAVIPEGPRETSTGWDNNDLKEIDHILVNKMIKKINRYRVITAEGFPSDHRPVIADITL